MSKPATVPEVKRYLRKADVAARYGLSERHIDRLTATGQLPKPIYISKFPMWSEARSRAPEGCAMIRRPVKLHYAAALQRMFKGAQLIRTNSNKRVEFEVSPGGPVSNATAQFILGHALCHPSDGGLLADTPQSWTFHRPTQ